MRYYSRDRNCCIDTCQAVGNLQTGSTVRADVTIRHPCLVRIRLEPRRNEFIIRSRLSNRDVCSFPREELEQDNSTGLDLTLLHGLSVKLLQDVKEETEATPAIIDNAFHITFPSDLDDFSDSQEDLHPEIEGLLLDVVARRKKQDELDISEYVRKKHAKFAEFEANVNLQAGLLSNIVLHSLKLDEGKRTSRRLRDADEIVERDRDRRLSSTSSQSLSSSTSGERTRKRSSKIKKEPPKRSSTAPLPKPALVTPLRKTSLAENSKQNGTSSAAAHKRVMFSEQEPTSIASAHLLEASDTEDEPGKAPMIVPTEPDDLFDMDEQIVAKGQISGLRSSAESTSPLSSPGEQSDAGHIHGPASQKNDKTHTRRLPEQLSSSNKIDSGTEIAFFATSLPRTIMRPTPAHAAPLSSVKDIPSISPSMADATLDFSTDDRPPIGVSRKTMWQQAVASSLRMSGLVLPTLTTEEIDAPLSAENLKPHKVQV